MSCAGSTRRLTSAAMDESTLAELTSGIVAALEPIVRRELLRLEREALARHFGRPQGRQTSAPAPKTAPALKAAPKRKAASKGPAPKPAALAKKAAAPAKTTRGDLSVEAIVAALTGREDGLRAEMLRKAMGLKDEQRRPLQGVLKQAVAMGLVTRKGEKRTTTYALKK